QDAMNVSLGDLRLPLIGDGLADAAQLLGDLRADFIDGLREAIADAASANPRMVSSLLFEYLGPSGANVLLKADGTPAESVDDIVLLTNVGDPGVATEDTFVEWRLHLGGALVREGGEIAFDLGLPGLGLETQGSVELDVDWRFDVAFGIDFVDGFYLDVGGANELRLDVDVTLPDAELVGRLGFLQLRIEDQDIDSSHP